ncbi:MAG TPA: MBL fold metallo-hydrolase [Gaiella sp.]|jgi:L-ascorbate metabolism protein UlaG (beta-lactamase superfamily)|nr:MBL fold metallo-hydrolase [Gaiella sp.]
MNITLVRSATLILETPAGRLLVDPMLDPAGARPPIEHTANPVRNPTVELPFPPEQVVEGIDAVLVTHRHEDHLDGTAVRLIPCDVPVFCQPEDEAALRELGLDARRVDDSVDWNDLTVRRVPAQHGFGEIAELLAPVSGFLIGDVYVAGDTVWYPGVQETIERFDPRVAIVNAGGASFVEGGLILMGVDDVREVVARVPTVVCVHLEALNHCFLTRAELAAAVPGAVLPRDGETVEV